MQGQRLLLAAANFISFYKYNWLTWLLMGADFLSKSDLTRSRAGCLGAWCQGLILLLITTKLPSIKAGGQTDHVAMFITDWSSDIFFMHVHTWCRSWQRRKVCWVKQSWSVKTCKQLFRTRRRSSRYEIVFCSVSDWQTFNEQNTVFLSNSVCPLWRLYIRCKSLKTCAPQKLDCF